MTEPRKQASLADCLAQSRRADRRLASENAVTEAASKEAKAKAMADLKKMREEDKAAILDKQEKKPSKGDEKKVDGSKSEGNESQDEPVKEVPVDKMQGPALKGLAAKHGVDITGLKGVKQLRAALREKGITGAEDEESHDDSNSEGNEPGNEE